MRFVIYISAGFVALFVLWILIFALIMPAFQNYVALSRAEAFCDSIKPGDSVDRHFPPKQEFKSDSWAVYDDDQYGALFAGHFFDDAECLVTVSDGKVKSTKSYMIYD